MSTMNPMRDMIHSAVTSLIEQNLEKQAADALTSPLKTALKEQSFLDVIIPPVPIGNNDLHPQVDTMRPVRVEQKLPNSPGAFAVPFQGGNVALHLDAERYRVMFYRLKTPRMWADIDELRTHVYDIRQHYLDQGVKDILELKDNRFIQSVNTFLGAAGSTVVETGTIQHMNIAGGITRDSVYEATDIMDSTPNRLQPATVLVNRHFMTQVAKWGRDEIGGNWSEEIMRRGIAVIEGLCGLRWVVTIKRDIVGDSEMFMFAPPEYLGRHYVLQDPVMWVKTEPEKVAFGAFTTIGVAIGNVAALAKATFI